MNWLLYSTVSAFAISAQFLLMKRLQKHYPISVYMTYIWLGAALPLIIIFTLNDVEIVRENLVIIILGAIGSFAGMYAYNKSINYQSNIGYVEAISSSRIALVYLTSSLLFSTSYSLKGLLGVILTIIGVFFVSNNEVTEKPKSKKWIPWALLSGIMFAVLIICSKIAAVSGVTAQSITAVIFAISGFFFLLSSFSQRVNLRIKQDIHILLFAILAAIIGNVAYFLSFVDTPNLAYPVSVSNSRIVILYLISLVITKEKVEKKKLFGILIVVIGILLLL